MQELEKILEEIEKAKGEHWYRLNNYDVRHKLDGAINRIVDIIRKHMDAGWIPVEERLPGEPKENPAFDDKPLELYLVDMGGGYPLRAFWNGKQFTDGWSVLNVIAWRPLPEPYRPERSEGE